MKTVVVLIFAFLTATQTFSKWMLLLDFSVNRDYIAANLCVNKAKPLSACGGKCQLKKAMEKEESTPASPAQQTKGKFQEVLFTPEALASLQSMQKKKVHHNSTYIFRYYQSPCPAIFHPPA